MGRARRIAGRLALVGAGAVVAQATLRALMASPAAPALDRTNHRGRTLSLASGPALAVAAATTAAVGAASAPVAVAALAAGLGAGAVGLYDDVVGARADQKASKGFRGHLSALKEGRVTSGLVKIGGIGVAGLAASALLSRGSGRGRGIGPRRSRLGGAANVLLGAGVIAGMANLVNLFDLRPGRALKVGLLVGAPLAVGPAAGLVAGPLGAAGVLLPDDLDERVMLGDSGANALGALLGLALAARSGPLTRAVLLAGIGGLTLASEKVSFTKVIERTPVLRAVDMWGRKPAPGTEPAAGAGVGVASATGQGPGRLPAGTPGGSTAQGLAGSRSALAGSTGPDGAGIPVAQDVSDPRGAGAAVAADADAELSGAEPVAVPQRGTSRSGTKKPRASKQGGAAGQSGASGATGPGQDASTAKTASKPVTASVEGESSARGAEKSGVS
ncbi:hypothetical protein Lfu02_72290 [Longispora fulva]|uniref:UDP-N-acetylmuramyl pentapeptide phosphotransferase/UDP-N-acetylglucosamine-1-phosphate transferase n=1 Tax=Longispora fulva TaxID=619741 RepID=A0A8J7G519_9ACTN|nr:UDP-N-acetylmuramyl pentapeptide phosphotransferase/UDP-N-acetylglucosamine-1-phosphate transferase [Longispora fulva]GIG62857.1 hypothetical protein Lfu02_72290 [Longispora fulva]